MKKYLKVEGLGSVRRCTYFFLLTNGNILVRCGCFLGLLDDFIAKVQETHGDNKHAKEYMMAVDMAKFNLLEETK